MKFRKKPVVIEAIQWDGKNWKDVDLFMLGCRHELWDGSLTIDIMTLEGTMTAMPEDWIIKGVQGEFYPCKPDIFEATYEPVEDGE